MSKTKQQPALPYAERELLQHALLGYVAHLGYINEAIDGLRAKMAARPPGQRRRPRRPARAATRTKRQRRGVPSAGA